MTTKRIRILSIFLFFIFIIQMIPYSTLAIELSGDVSKTYWSEEYQGTDKYEEYQEWLNNTVLKSGFKPKNIYGYHANMKVYKADKAENKAFKVVYGTRDAVDGNEKKMVSIDI